MKVCKWCRKPIEEGVQRMSTGELIAWVHSDSWYSCIPEEDPSKQAEPADERWEKVYARITPFDAMSDAAKANVWDEATEFLIEVYYQDQRHGARILVPERDLAWYRNQGIYAYVLDSMVEDIDELLEAVDGA